MKLFTVNLTKEQREFLQEMSKKTGISMTNIIRSLINKEMKKNDNN